MVPAPPKKSSVWNFFIKGSDPFTAVCKFCTKTLRTCGNTTNLSLHLERLHKNHINKENKEMEMSRSATTSASTPSTSTSVSNLSTASTVTIGNEEQENLSSPDLKQSTIKGTFNKIEQFKTGGKKEKQLTTAIAYMIVKDNLPFFCVENEGFLHFLSVATPFYKPPSRRTITRLIDNKFEELSVIFKEKVANYDCLCLTTDMWTETHTTIAYLGVTMHFKEGDIMKGCTIGVYEFGEKHTAVNIGEKLQEATNEWNIDLDKILGVVTDNGANIVRAICDTFGVQKHIRCFAHTLNLVAENSLKAVESISILIEKVKRVVTWFKHCLSANAALRKCQVEDGIPEEKTLKLIQCVETRWNSKFYMIKRFLHLRTHINKIMLNERTAPDTVNGYEFDILKELMPLLQTLEVVTRELSSEKYVTLSKVIPLVRCMESELEACDPEDEELKIFKQKLKSEIEKRFGKMEQVDKLAISTILDPRFKKIRFKDYNAVAKAVSIIKKKLENNLTTARVENQNTPESDDDDESTSEERSSDKELNLWKHHTNLVNQLQTKFNDKQENMTRVNSELSQYLCSSVFPLETNPLEAWNNKLKVTYPHIYELAIQYLQIPATSVPAERLFSKAGQVITDQRSRIKPKRMSKLLFLSSYWDLSLE